MGVLDNRNNIADVNQQYEAMSIHVVRLHVNVCKLCKYVCKQKLYDQYMCLPKTIFKPYYYLHTHTHTHTHTSHQCVQVSVCVCMCVCVCVRVCVCVCVRVCSPRSEPCVSHSLITPVGNAHTKPYSLTLFWLHIFHCCSR